MTDEDLLRLHEQLERQEARRRFPYMDCCGKPWRECYGHPRGNMTIGIGINLDSGLSDEEIDLLLASRLSLAESDCRRVFPWFSALDSVRQAALVNICFNLGLTRLLGFEHALSAMALGDYALAADEFLDSRWARQVGQRAVELAGQIRSGEWDDGSASSR